MFVCVESWAGSPITFNSILFWLIVGITYGSVYAVAATGLVVTYTTSGIFNFAQGAIGMFLAYIFWQLQVDWGIQTFVALLLTVFVAAPIMGALIERVLMRRHRRRAAGRADRHHHRSHARRSWASRA